MTDPTGVLALVRTARLHMCDDFQCTAYEDYGKLARNALEPLVEALVATNTELKGYAIASETVKILDQGEKALAGLQEQLQKEQAGA